MRFKKLVLILAAVLVAASLAACSSAGDSSGNQSSGGQPSGQQGSGQQGGQQEQAQGGSNAQGGSDSEKPTRMTEEAKERQVAPQAGSGGDSGNEGNELEPAEDKTLRLTVPKMAEIKNDEIPTGKGTDENLFRDYAAVRLRYTGFPWQEEANIYIAGHRIGFPGTSSDLAFYDLEDLADGDEVFLEDAEGRRYTYVVFKKMVVEPTDLSVLKPIEGRNIVTLQTCTLPDYTDRVIYQAELKNVEA